jgi:hypothetical protein
MSRSGRRGRRAAAVRGRSRYRLLTQDFGNPGVTIRDLNGDGLPEFITGDGRFAYRFTDYADSAWPIEVERYINGAFVDVTRRFPEQIRADATRLLRGAVGRADLRASSQPGQPTSAYSAGVGRR